MPGPKVLPIEVSGREKAILEQIVRGQNTPQWLVTRAKIILKASASQTNTQIAQELSLTRKTVRTWRQRWQASAEQRTAMLAEEENDKAVRQLMEDILCDAYRSGAPTKFSAEQVVQIIAIACEDPQVSGYPISHWTPKEVAAESIRRGIVASISERQVGRFLK